MKGFFVGQWPACVPLLCQCARGAPRFGQPSLQLPPRPFPPFCSSLTTVPSPCLTLGVFDVCNHQLKELQRSCCFNACRHKAEEEMPFTSLQELSSSWENLYSVRASKSPLLWSDCSAKQWSCLFSPHVHPHGTSTMVPVRELCPCGYLLMVALGLKALYQQRGAPRLPHRLPLSCL